MKNEIYLSLMLSMALTTGCNMKEKKPIDNLDLSNMDTTIVAGDNFYDYATKGWQMKNPLKGEYARYGTFDLLRSDNQERLKTLVEDLVASTNQNGTPAQKVADFYKAGLDSARLNEEGVTPIKEYLEYIDNIDDQKAIPVVAAEMFRRGVYPFFSLYVDADAKNSSINILSIVQGGLGIGQKDYYLEENEMMSQIRDKYKNYIKNIFQLAGFDSQRAENAVANILALEIQLAKASKSQSELRDPDANYNKFTIEDFEKRYPSLNFPDFLSAAKSPEVKSLNVCQPEFFDEVEKIYSSASLNQLKDYMILKLLSASAPFLNDAMYNEYFEFYGKTLSGKTEQQPRWKRALTTTDNALGEVLGEIYVEKYFPAEAKQRMLVLVKNLQNALGQRISNLEWMGDETKKKALEKLSTFTIKIGYPDKWRDYSALTISSEDSYVNMVVRSNEFDWDYAMADVDKPVDKQKWYMTPQTVNAYYNPSTNEICFPAAILQPPFFYLDGDDPINYGAIGVVIGHEMTHGFDDQGRKFDKDGNLNEWWTEDDSKRFEERSSILADQFDSIKVINDVHANGKFTLGENIADQGGIMVAHTALENALASSGKKDELISGLNYDQRFLLAYATLWAGNIRDEEIIRLTKIDPHSLGRWRVNGTLPNIPFFYEAFSVTENNKMYKAPEKRVIIW